MSGAVDAAGELTGEALIWTQENVVSPYVSPDVDITMGRRAARESAKAAAKRMEAPETKPNTEKAQSVGGLAEVELVQRGKIALRVPAPDSLLEQLAAKIPQVITK